MTALATRHPTDGGQRPIWVPPLQCQTCVKTRRLTQVLEQVGFTRESGGIAAAQRTGGQGNMRRCPSNPTTSQTLEAFLLASDAERTFYVRCCLFRRARNSKLVRPHRGRHESIPREVKLWPKAGPCAA